MLRNLIVSTRVWWRLFWFCDYVAKKLLTNFSTILTLCRHSVETVLVFLHCNQKLWQGLSCLVVPNFTLVVPWIFIDLLQSLVLQSLPGRWHRIKTMPNCLSTASRRWSRSVSRATTSTSRNLPDFPRHLVESEPLVVNVVHRYRQPPLTDGQRLRRVEHVM